MRFPFEAHQGNRIPFQNNIPGRTFRNPPHPENATHYSAKNRVASSQALDATLAQGVSPTAGRKGTSPAAAFGSDGNATGTSATLSQPRERRCFGNDRHYDPIRGR
jgi:hypothetical protein